MCGRFTLTKEDPAELAQDLGVPAEQVSSVDYRPRYNIAPRSNHWIVRMTHEDREALPARWGLVNARAKDDKRAAQQINAQADTLKDRPAFRNALRKRRCVVPADGFYEWTGSKKEKKPIWFNRSDGGLLLFAGLYESWHPEPDESETTFTIVTTTPNSLISPIHDRMPVILPEEAVDQWLFGSEAEIEKLTSLLVAAPDSLLSSRPVSTLVNSVKNGGLELLSEQTPLEVQLET